MVDKAPNNDEVNFKALDIPNCKKLELLRALFVCRGFFHTLQKHGQAEKVENIYNTFFHHAVIKCNIPVSLKINNNIRDKLHI
jgi:hypothetical protein